MNNVKTQAQEFNVAADISKNRLDKFLAAEVLELSRSKVQSLIINGCVRVNSLIITDPNHYLKLGDRIRILLENNLVDERPDLSADSSVPFSILYEDEDLLVIDKPAGVTVHPGAGNHSHTLVNGLIYHCGASLSGGSHQHRPGIVHRLDKDTSGILVVAKNDFSHGELAKQFSVHSIKRKYLCFCYGILQPLNGKIETLIARDKNNRLKMAVVPENGRHAITLYKTLKTFSTFASKVECELKTGRTHQIRVQLSQRRCSLLGDALYKAKNYAVPREIADFVNNFSRQALHAYFLEFVHPRSGKMLHFEIDLPADMRMLEENVTKIQRT
ncbi:MAG: RluA family pseudouridine synthase [Holosporaceae bacterium]|jgi:23S rRNA pseudouridine1911/1915/1917 synthase|nr:RluA family pseudouridine synthase [Holosporaceae bacterium]